MAFVNAASAAATMAAGPKCNLLKLLACVSGRLSAVEAQGHSGRPSAVAAAGAVTAAGATAAKDQHEGSTQDAAGTVSQPRHA